MSVEILITFSVHGIRNLDAIVEEQDTNLLLGPITDMREVRESYRTLIKQMQDQPARSPGEIIIKDQRPVRLLAVVYDLEQEPVCQTAAIKQVLADLMVEIQKHRFKVVAMPMLGTTYGPLGVEEFFNLLRDTISSRLAYPEILWLTITPLQYLQAFSFISTFNTA